MSVCRIKLVVGCQSLKMNRADDSEVQIDGERVMKGGGRERDRNRQKKKTEKETERERYIPYI